LSKRYFGNAKVYVFGSVVWGITMFILSDVDVAVIINCENNENIYRFKTEIAETLEMYYEVDILNKRLWNFYKRFINAFEEI
jgi:predicted nucleotidyltransferase